MQVDKIQLRYYKALPLAGLCSPLIDRLNRGESLPPVNRELVDSLKDSIQVNGMRNPLSIEWFDPYHPRTNPNPSWSIRIGNNRAVALIELGQTTAPCLVLVPEGVEGPAGTYDEISKDAALALFTADHPWWDSWDMQHMFPNEVPKRG